MGLLDDVLGVGSALLPVAGGIARGVTGRREAAAEAQKAAIEEQYRQQQIAKSIEDVRLEREKRDRETETSHIKDENNRLAHGEYSRVAGNEGTPYSGEVNWAEEMIKSRQPRTMSDFQFIASKSPEEQKGLVGLQQNLHPPRERQPPQLPYWANLTDEQLRELKRKRDLAGMGGVDEEGMSSSDRQTAERDAKTRASTYFDKVVNYYGGDAKKAYAAIGPAWTDLAAQEGPEGRVYSIAQAMLVEAANKPPKGGGGSKYRTTPTPTTPVATTTPTPVKDAPRQAPKFSQAAIEEGRRLAAKGLGQDSVMKLLRAKKLIP